MKFGALQNFLWRTPPKSVVGFVPYIFLFLFSFTLLAAEPKPMDGVDFVSLPVVRKGELSPNGETLVFQKSQADWKRNRWITQLWMKELASGELRQLTYSSGEAWEPLWSPDGGKLLFFSKRDEDKSPQLYLMPVDGGEARRLGEFSNRPSQLKWSPDGDWIYFLIHVERAEDEQKLVDELKIIPRFEDPRQRQVLKRIRISDGEVEQVSGDADSIFDFDLSQNGESLLLLKGKGVLIDDRQKADLWFRTLKDKESKRITQNQIAKYGAKFSPNAEKVAYLSDANEKDEGYHKLNLFMVDCSSGERTLLSKEFVGEIQNFAWEKASKGLYFLGNTGVSNHLFYLELEGGTITQLTSGPWTIKEWSYDPATESHIYKRESATEPGDFWIIREGQAPARLTHIHGAIAERYQIPRQELVKWQSDDGVWIEGLLTYPLNYKEGTPFALITDTHGGPQRSDQHGEWSLGRYMPVLAAHGYGVLRVNHRGSTGYGDEFMRDMVGNYFRNAHLDVLSGIDHLVAEGLADPNQLVKKGWSAGGHMTNKLITYTNRFKVASSGAGVVDWDSQFGETDTFYRRTWWFDGKPWQKDAPVKKFQDASPLSELWKVKTPTLIFVGEKDVRVPSSQSKILFRALRDLGVETELYIAPGEPHSFRKPTHRLFRINKELEWFERHVRGLKYDYSIPEEFENNAESANSD